MTDHDCSRALPNENPDVLSAVILLSLPMAVTRVQFPHKLSLCHREVPLSLTALASGLCALPQVLKLLKLLAEK